MQQSRRAIEDAGKRLSGIEDRLKHLDAEIAGLRNSALQEAAAERARIEQMAEVDARKIATTAEQEIAAAAKVARQELKVYASELALNLAEEKIRRSISAQSDKEIFRSFVEDLRDGSNGAGNGAGGA
jgi:F-type H+-transporting ATPase subunit b